MTEYIESNCRCIIRPPVAREVTLEPAPTVKRVDMEKLLALPADEFQRVVNGTPGLRELLDGE